MLSHQLRTYKEQDEILNLLIKVKKIYPEIIEAIRRLEAGSKTAITGADITLFQSFGGRDHCDPTLVESPIRVERLSAGSKLR